MHIIIKVLTHTELFIDSSFKMKKIKKGQVYIFIFDNNYVIGWFSSRQSVSQRISIQCEITIFECKN